MRVLERNLVIIARQSYSCCNCYCERIALVGMEGQQSERRTQNILMPHERLSILACSLDAQSTAPRIYGATSAVHPSLRCKNLLKVRLLAILLSILQDSLYYYSSSFFNKYLGFKK